MPILSLLGLWQEPGSPSPEDHYAAELSRGTAHLLNATRERLARLFDGGPAAAEAAGLFGVGAGAGSQPVAWPLGSDAQSARPVPAGFSEPLLLALKHPWAGARLVPMAANVQWELYDCGGGAGAATGAGAAMRGLWTKMLHNEREIPFPACNAGSGAAVQWVEPDGNVDAGRFGLRFPCPWDKVKAYYRTSVYKDLGVGTCDAETYSRMCGGISSVCETDAGLRSLNGIE